VDMRELKALEIAARLPIAFADGVWVVPSQSSSAKYRVNLDAPSCTCEDFSLRGSLCKHIHAARLVRERDHGGKAPTMNTDVIPKRPTYKQNWPAYNLAQMTEKKRFQELLVDLCRGMKEEQPEKRGRGRPKTSMADIVFTCGLKVYTTFSSRRFACDLKDAYENGHISHLLHSVSVCAFLESKELTPVLEELITITSLPLKAVETVFAPDSTGFSTSRFVRWYDEKYGVQRSSKDWVKAHAMCGVKTNVVTAVRIEGRDAADCPQFKPLVEATVKSGFNVQEVPADKAYLSKENLELVAGLGGTAFVPFKTNSLENDGVWAKMYHYFQFRREEFLKHYHQRSNAESTFSMIKAKFRDHVRSKTDVAMKNEVLCKFLCHNICCVIMSQCELGIEAAFWPEEPNAATPQVLPMVRPG